MNDVKDFCVPGERLGSITEFTSGSGTYERNGFIYSKLSGTKVNKIDENGKNSIEVYCKMSDNVIPEVNAIAMCKVVTNNPRYCKVKILSINRITLKTLFKGTIRQEDVRATEKDRVKMNESFQLGDIVLARIMSLGDSQSYFLTTAENELGVIYALSSAGYPMVPISWCQMQCTKTGSIEHRKVAKVKISEI